MITSFLIFSDLSYPNGGLNKRTVKTFLKQFYFNIVYT